MAFAEWEGKGHQHHKNITKLTKDGLAPPPLASACNNITAFQHAALVRAHMPTRKQDMLSYINDCILHRAHVETRRSRALRIAVEVLLKKQAEEEAKAKDGPQKRDNKDVNTWSSNEVPPPKPILALTSTRLTPWGVS